MNNFENALKRVGENGIYQIKVMIVFGLNVFTIGSQIISPTYSYIKPHLFCDGSICIENQETCNSDFIIDPEFKHINIVTEFNLFCNRDFYIYIATSINFLGSLFAGAYVSYLADNYGRRITYQGTLILQVLAYSSIYFCSTIQQLIAFNFFMGFATTGNYILMPVIINEICGTAYRQIYNLLILTIWSVAVILLPIGFQLFIDWRTIQLIFIIIPSIIALILSLFVLLETPKYYYSKNDRQSTLEVLEKMAQINQEPDLHEFSLDLNETVNEKSKYTLFDLFRYQSLTLPSLGFILISYGLHLLYYGSQYGLRQFQDQGLIYVLGFVVGVVELISNIILMFLIQQLYRKQTIILSLVSSIICCLSCFIFGLEPIRYSCELCLEEIFLIIVIALIRISVIMGFGIQGIWSTEFYPTPLRTIGTGFLFSIGLLGSFSAPYIQALSKQLQFNIYVLIGLITLPTLLGTLITKETKGQHLKDRIEEEEYSQLHSEEHSRDQF